MEFHGGTRRRDLLDFSISVNPYVPEWAEGMFEECRRLAPKYSHTEWLDERFEEVYGKGAVITAGATEAFQIIGFTLMDGAEAVIPFPSYGEFERVAKFSAAGIHTGLDLFDSFGLSKRLARSGRKTVLIFSSPNNPTGLCAPKEAAGWIEEAEDAGVIVAVDEAFGDFVEDPFEICTPKTIRIGSFTKSYGMPGIRVGYVKSEIPDLFRNHRAPWGIGACGHAFVERLIEDGGEFLGRTMPRIWMERKRFEAFGMKTDANFGTVEAGDAQDFQGTLDGMGVHVRSCESFGMPDRVRVSVRTKEENDVLFRAIEKTGFLRREI